MSTSTVRHRVWGQGRGAGHWRAQSETVTGAYSGRQVAARSRPGAGIHRRAGLGWAGLDWAAFPQVAQRAPPLPLQRAIGSGQSAELPGTGTS
jgi:hypothetical protein